MNNSISNKYRPLILIVDDDFGKRERIASFIEDKYDVLKADTGLTGLSCMQKLRNKLSLVLLDINMPELNGYEVLTLMNRNGLIDDIPVMVITTDEDSATFQRSYNLGVTDFIGPVVDGNVIQNRVKNTLIMHEKQKTLARIISDQIRERDNSNNMMITILGHIVEFRNEESGKHVLHVATIVEILLNTLKSKTNKYNLDETEISRIAMASRLHDIGKIAISEDILNKPGRLSDEEYEIMKTHTIKAAELLDELHEFKDEPIVKIARDIALWHHERFDGKGYPDGLVGDEIPISAQAMSLADVYDALTSERAYKKAFSHEDSLKMILDGECGTFNPLLLECLVDSHSQIIEHINDALSIPNNDCEVEQIVNEAMRVAHDTIAPESNNSPSNFDEIRPFKVQEQDYMLSNTFAELRFVYNAKPFKLELSKELAQYLKLPDSTIHDLTILESFITRDQLKAISELFEDSTNSNPIVEIPITLCIDSNDITHKLYAVTNLIDKSEDDFNRAYGRITRNVF